MPHRLRLRPPGARRLVPAALLAWLSVGSAWAGPTVGFREDWAGTSTNGWGGGSGGGASYSNPGSGGSGGSGDGYLLVTQVDPGPYGARSTGAAYAGDWRAAGVEFVRVSISDVGAADHFEIHFCIGNASNFWQFNTGFVPPNGAWQEFVVDLTDSTKWTRIIGSGTFTQALQLADRILLRNDSAPFIQTPDLASGDLGIDGIVLTNVPTRVRATTWGRIKRLYR